jgi:hypothetical protein
MLAGELYNETDPEIQVDLMLVGFGGGGINDALDQFPRSGLRFEQSVD